MVSKAKARTIKYIRHKLTQLKEEIKGNTIIIEDFNTSFWIMDKSMKKYSKFKHYIQMDLIECTEHSI